MKNHPVINTHSHHLQDYRFQRFNLNTVLRQSYVNWYQVPLKNTYESRANYLEKIDSTPILYGWKKSLQELYDFNEPLTADNWEEMSSKNREGS